MLFALLLVVFFVLLLFVFFCFPVSFCVSVFQCAVVLIFGFLGAVVVLGVFLVVCGVVRVFFFHVGTVCFCKSLFSVIEIVVLYCASSSACCYFVPFTFVKLFLGIFGLVADFLALNFVFLSYLCWSRKGLRRCSPASCCC